MELAGQWIGKSDDGSSLVVLDLDEDPPGTRGTGRIFFRDGGPGASVFVELPAFDGEHRFSSEISWISQGSPDPKNVQQIRHLYPDRDFPETATITLVRAEDLLKLNWSTRIGTLGNLVLHRVDKDAPSELEAKEMSWDRFKSFALANTPGAMIFRGQPAPYRLRTAFHRTYRKDLVRYARVDIPTALKHLTARTAHLFNLDSPQETGAFYNLLQHHGFPTPLLDWTLSPFVAAFFAYRKRQSDKERGKKVRILAFEKEKWESAFNQVARINYAKPHFSMLDALAIENLRAIPQQALSTLTNIDDIEGYICGIEQERDETFLHAIDLDPDDRSVVMSELSLMGITAGSLFPGLDGACEELHGRFFHHQVPANPGALKA